MVSLVPRNALFLLAAVVVSASLLLSSMTVEGFVTTTTTPPVSASAGATVLHDKKWGDEQSEKKNGGGGLFGAVSNFFEELDAFVDDATARRLGAGAQYYGKRKSSFYGDEDKQKKLDKNVADSAEDFMVNAGGNFKWITDEDGNLRPVSRMKQTSVEKPAKMWGRQDNKTTPTKLNDRMQE